MARLPPSNAFPCTLIAILASTALLPVAAAQEAGEAEHTLIFEAGAAGERNVRGGSANFGPALAVEVTPIEEWLEIEAGAAALGTQSGPDKGTAHGVAAHVEYSDRLLGCRNLPGKPLSSCHPPPSSVPPISKSTT
jgi:hypothetical protein